MKKMGNSNFSPESVRDEDPFSGDTLPAPMNLPFPTTERGAPKGSPRLKL